ncbi:MAG: ABC transporter ATPase [Saprospiraceae bacterium]|nr:ABC transporter ATPase [Bacteroidia bacterium]NNE15987.1 ABC transporter ATPase [Saprospiraceae bacterium]NNL93223.1 ABC transporter ATPase [Saprospiraceae bacterium]
MRRDLIALPDNSRVWIYQANRMFNNDETERIQSDIYDFTLKWNSHGKELDCYGHLFHKMFLVFVADENNHVSGCSIDSSVHFIQALGSKFNVDFFDRLNYVFFENDEINIIFHTEMKSEIENGRINEETLFFNNLVNTKESFINDWVQPMKDSWLNRYLI